MDSTNTVVSLPDASESNSHDVLVDAFHAFEVMTLGLTAMTIAVFWLKSDKSSPGGTAHLAMWSMAMGFTTWTVERALHYTAVLSGTFTLNAIISGCFATCGVICISRRNRLRFGQKRPDPRHARAVRLWTSGLGIAVLCAGFAYLALRSEPLELSSGVLFSAPSLLLLGLGLFRAFNLSAWDIMTIVPGLSASLYSLYALQEVRQDIGKALETEWNGLPLGLFLKASLFVSFFAYTNFIFETSRLPRNHGLEFDRQRERWAAWIEDPRGASTKHAADRGKPLPREAPPTVTWQYLCDKLLTVDEPRGPWPGFVDRHQQLWAVLLTLMYGNPWTLRTEDQNRLVLQPGEDATRELLSNRGSDSLARGTQRSEAEVFLARAMDSLDALGLDVREEIAATPVSWKERRPRLRFLVSATPPPSSDGHESPSAGS